MYNLTSKNIPLAIPFWHLYKLKHYLQHLDIFYKILESHFVFKVENEYKEFILI